MSAGRARPVRTRGRPAEPAAPTSTTSPTPTSTRCGTAASTPRTDPSVIAGRRRGDHLRADAAVRRRRPRPRRRARGRPRDRRPADPADAGRAGVHHLPRHHRGGRSARSWSELRSRPPAATSIWPSRPERIDPGNAQYGVRNTPKVVGGLTAAARTRRARSTRGSSTPSCEARGTREAEMAKLLENTYRHVNIALVNEMARFCHELGHRLVGRDPAARRPSRSASRRSTRARASAATASRSTRTTCRTGCAASSATRSGSSSWPRRSTRRCRPTSPTARRTCSTRTARRSTAQVLLLGVTYKPDIADERESPATPLAKRLMSLGAEVSFHDPHVNRMKLAGISRVEGDLLTAVHEADLVILVQNHRAYDADELQAASVRFLDTRGVTAKGERL